MKANIVKILISLLTALALLACLGALAEDNGENSETRQDAILMVNGEIPEQTLNIKTHERFYLRVPLPEGTTMARVVEKVGDEVTGCAYLFDWDGWDEKLEEGRWGWADEYSDEEEFTLYAQLTTKDFDWEDFDWDNFDWDNEEIWTQTSNEVKINVSFTDTEPVAASVINVPDTVTWGDPLTFTVEKFGDGVGWLWCNVYYEGEKDEDDEEVNRYFLHDNHVDIYAPNATDTDVTGSIGTFNLEPGDYMLHVSNVPVETGKAESYGTYKFTVVEPDTPLADGTFLFNVAPTEGLTAHRSFALSAYYKAANGENVDWIRVIKDDGEREKTLTEREGDTLVQECNDLGEGHYKLYAVVSVDGKEKRSDTIELDVTADDFEGFALDAPAIAEPGQDYTFSVKNLGLADDWWWDVSVNEIVEGEDWPCVYRVTAEDMSADAAGNEITVPGEVIKADTGYEIRVCADARFYGSTDLTGGFYATANKAENPVELIASYGDQESSEAISLPSFDEFTLSVNIPEGATALRVYDGREFRLVHAFWNAEGDTVEWTEEPDAENYAYFVSFSFDDRLADMEPDEIDMDEYDWDGISNVISVTLEYSDIELIVPELVVESDTFTFTRGDEISLTISLPDEKPEGAVAPTRLHAFFTDSNDEYYGEGDWGADEIDWSEGIEATLDTSRLPAGRTYRIALDYAAVGTEWKRLNSETVVVNGVPLTLSLTVDGKDAEAGEDGVLTVLTHQKLGMTVNLPDDAVDARLVMEMYYFDDEGNIDENDEPECEYEYIDDLEDKLNTGRWSQKLDYGWPERRVLYVEIFTAEEEWSRRSNEVTLDIVTESDKATDECKIVLGSEEVAKGEPLAFTVEEYGENAQWLWCFLRRAEVDEDGKPVMDGEYPVFDESDEWNELLEPNGISVNRPQKAASIPTANLEPGIYYMQVNGVASVPGLWESVQLFPFTVKDETAWSEGEFYFNVSPSEGLLAHQEFTVTARMEGAEMIRVLWDDGERVDTLIDWVDGDTLNETADLNAGTYTLHAQAFMGEDADEPYLRSDPDSDQLLIIGVPDDSLKPYEIDAPALADPDDTYAFTVSNLDQANDFWWELRVNRIVPGEEWPEIMYVNSDDMSAESEQKFTIPGDFMIPGAELEPGWGYEISLWADALNYGGKEVTARFYVSDAEKNGDIRLTAYYNRECVADGTGDATITVPNRAEVLLVIESTGENIPTALKLYNGNDWDLNEEPDDGRWETTVRPEEDCSIYFASAYYGDQIDWEALEEADMGWEDLDWSGPSNTITVKVVNDGDALTAPKATINYEDLDNVRRGDTLEVTLEKPEDNADCGTDFHVYFSDLDGERYESGDWNADGVELPVTAELRTADLPDDNVYNVMVDYVADGREWQSVNAGRIVVVRGDEGELQLSVTGLEKDGEQENAYVGHPNQEIGFSAYMPGAASVWVFWDDADAEEGEHRFEPFRGEESVSDTLREGDDGEYVIYAVAYDAEGEIIGESDTISVSLAFVQLKDPVITAPSTADAGKDYIFTVEGLEIEGSDWWWLEVYDTDVQDDEGNPKCVFDTNKNWWEAGEQEFTIPADALTPNHAYWICAHVDGEGCEGGYSEAQFIVKPASQGHDLTLEVQKTVEGDGMVHHPEHWKITVHAPEAKAVRLWVEGEWHYEESGETDDDGNWLYNGWWFDESGEHEMFAQALYGETDDWADADTSDTVKFTVSSRGEASPVKLDRDQYEVIPGNSFEVVILDDDAYDPKPTILHAYIQRQDGWVDWENDVNVNLDDPEQTSFEIRVSEDIDTEMEYDLVVDGCAEDYEWAQTRVPLELCYGQLDAPVVEAGYIAREDEGFTFNVKNLIQTGEENYWYDIRVYQEGKEYSDEEWEWRATPEEGGSDTGEFTVTGLEAGHTYFLDVWLDAYRYMGNSAQLRFAVYDKDQVLELPRELTSLGDEAFEGVAAQVIVLPEGFDAGKLGADTFKDCPNLLAVVQGDKVIYPAED